MSNPWYLYDRLLEPIGDSVTVEDYQVGRSWTQVHTSEGSVGLAMNTEFGTRP